MFIKFPDGENNSFQITFETDGDGYVAVSTPDGKIHGVNMTHAQFEALGKVLLGHSRGARALPDSKTTIGKKAQHQVDFLFAAKNDLQRQVRELKEQNLALHQRVANLQVSVETLGGAPAEKDNL